MNSAAGGPELSRAELLAIAKNRLQQFQASKNLPPATAAVLATPLSAETFQPRSLTTELEEAANSRTPAAYHFAPALPVSTVYSHPPPEYSPPPDFPLSPGFSSAPQGISWPTDEGKIQTRENLTNQQHGQFTPVQSSYSSFSPSIPSFSVGPEQLANLTRSIALLSGETDQLRTENERLLNITNNLQGGLKSQSQKCFDLTADNCRLVEELGLLEEEIHRVRKSPEYGKPQSKAIEQYSNQNAALDEVSHNALKIEEILQSSYELTEEIQSRALAMMLPPQKVDENQLRALEAHEQGVFQTPAAARDRALSDGNLEFQPEGQNAQALAISQSEQRPPTFSHFPPESASLSSSDILSHASAIVSALERKAAIDDQVKNLLKKIKEKGNPVRRMLENNKQQEIKYITNREYSSSPSSSSPSSSSSSVSSVNPEISSLTHQLSLYQERTQALIKDKILLAKRIESTHEENMGLIGNLRNSIQFLLKEIYRLQSSREREFLLYKRKIHFLLDGKPFPQDFPYQEGEERETLDSMDTVEEENSSSFSSPFSLTAEADDYGKMEISRIEKALTGPKWELVDFHQNQQKQLYHRELEEGNSMKLSKFLNDGENENHEKALIPLGSGNPRPQQRFNLIQSLLSFILKPFLSEESNTTGSSADGREEIEEEEEEEKSLVILV